jgi:hypothetical protein
MCTFALVPIALITRETHVLCFCMQGGGVYVQSGTVAITSCTISGNTVVNVHALAQNFPSPRWENALLTCNSTLAVLLESNTILPGICTCQPRLQNVYCPDGIFTCFALCASRVVVSLSMEAESRLQLPRSSAMQLPEMCALLLKTSHRRPGGKIADALALILACATSTDATANYRGCVLKRP